MEKELARLENVCARLEKFEAALSSGVVSKPQPSSDSSTSDLFLNEYDTLLLNVQTLVNQSQPLGADVSRSTSYLQEAFKGTRTILSLSVKIKKPDMAEFQKLLEPIGSAIGKASSMLEGKRTDAFNHLKTVADAIVSLQWLMYDGPASGMNAPAQHVAESWSSAEFYANKILVQYRNTDDGQPHVLWVKAFKDLMKAQEAYVKKFFPTGVKWNPAGTTATQALAAAGGSAPVTPPSAAPPPAATAAAPTPAPTPENKGPAPGGRGAPPPPPGPPPPPPPLEDPKSEQKPATDVNALMKELCKGEGITGGLKKVTDDMKSKNRTDRSGLVTAAPVKAPTSAATASAAAGKPGKTGKPVLELTDNGRRWLVEFQEGNQGIVLDSTTSNQIVQIYGCNNCTIQVPGKVSKILVDSCTKLGIVFDKLISGCEVVNCNELQLQVKEHVPTISIEKTDSAQIFLGSQVVSDENFQIVTAKCAAVNVVVLPDDADMDSVEQPIPEQFVSVFKNGKLVTTSVAHSGA